MRADILRALLALLLLAGLEVGAATATLSTGASCTYQGLTIDQAGNVVVQCGSVPTMPPAGESCAEFVNRLYQQYAHTAPDSGGFSYWVSQCSSGAQTRAQIEAAFAAAYPPTPPTQPPAGCNPSAVQPPIAWGEVRQQRAASGQVMAFPLAASPDWHASINFTQGQQPSTAGGTVTEFTVSQCPGVINPAAGACYYSSPFTNNNTLDIYLRDVSVAGCLANAPGAWYINVRWTYPACPFGACGFSLQWAVGPW